MYTFLILLSGARCSTNRTFLFVYSDIYQGVEGVVRGLEGTPRWQVYTNKTRVMTFIPTKSFACMSTSWLLGNIYTAKSCKGKIEILTL
jgi:hypothetical protein